MSSLLTLSYWGSVSITIHFMSLSISHGGGAFLDFNQLNSNFVTFDSAMKVLVGI